MKTWICRELDSAIWAVGFYGPDGWYPDSYHSTAKSAADRVDYLNCSTWAEAA